jgi:hypothetical protein
MAVDAAALAELKAIEAGLPDAPGPFDACTSHCELISCVIAFARAEGRDELSDIELLLAAAELPIASRRKAATALARLGYSADIVALLRGRKSPKK